MARRKRRRSRAMVTSRPTRTARRYMRSCKTSDNAEDLQRDLEDIETEMENLMSNVDAIEEKVGQIEHLPKMDEKYFLKLLREAVTALDRFKTETGMMVYDAQEAADLLNAKEQGFDL